MAGRSDITSERLLEYLSWDWQDVEELRQRLIPTVAPGKALRTYQSRYKGKGPSPLTEDEQIISGARAIVNDRINTVASSGRIEYDNDRTRLRFTERRVVDKTGCCPTCYRPFPETATEKPQPSSSDRNVVYPTFPTWEEHEQKRMGAR